MHLENSPSLSQLEKSQCSNEDQVLLLLLLSRFSCVRLCATPETGAHQAPLSLGFSRQEHWSGLPFQLRLSSVNRIFIFTEESNNPAFFSERSVVGLLIAHFWGFFFFFSFARLFFNVQPSFAISHCGLVI